MTETKTSRGTRDRLLIAATMVAFEAGFISSALAIGGYPRPFLLVALVAWFAFAVLLYILLEYQLCSLWSRAAGRALSFFHLLGAALALATIVLFWNFVGLGQGREE